MPEKDFLDEQIVERTAKNPDYPRLLEAAEGRRTLLRTLASIREEKGESQEAVAAAIGSSQSSLARIESADGDVRLSTVDRIVSALGYRVEFHLVPADQPGPAVVRQSEPPRAQAAG